MKKILFLGASPSQVPAIRYAKESDYYVITCDNNPKNPGHLLANKTINISTTDYSAVLEVARKEKIDAVSSYASDPGAYTAALICDQLMLVGPSLRAVEILGSKENFRKFLKTNNFNYPEYEVGSNMTNFLHIEDFPGILKPTDSSGSKGVFRVNNLEEIKLLFGQTKKYSREGKVIYEKYIERKGPQIHGEAFVINNEIVFFQLGDQYFSPVNELAPYCTIVPSKYHSTEIDQLKIELNRLIKKIDFGTGGLNIEAMVDQSNKAYFIEIGPRSGGNYMPNLMLAATNVNLIKMNVDALLISNYSAPSSQKCIDTCQIIFHAFRNGRFDNISIPPELAGCELKRVMTTERNEPVEKYKNSRDVVGVGIYNLESVKRKAVEKVLTNHEFVTIL